MACSQQFSSQSTTHDAASTPASTTSSSSASLFSAGFSVFQEGPGQPLVFSPPLHTPELLALVDRFLALDVPIPMKMDMLRCDFEAHVARTNERYKTYFVPAASPAPAPAVAAVPSPSVFTASPAPLLFPTPLEASAAGSLSSSSGDSSCSGSLFFDAPSTQRLRPSPTESPVLASAADTTSSSVFPLSVPMFPSIADYSAFYGDAAGAGFAYPPAAAARARTPSTATTSPRSARGALRPSRGPSQRRHLTDDSLQILTRTGENVTHASSRATRTHEDRENTRLVRQRGACPDCRRKKQRCAPGHAGAVQDRSAVAPRPAAPYTAPAQSGRAKQEAAAAQAARTAQDKVEGKRPEAIVEQPVLFDDVAWARNSPLPSSISPADDLSLLDSLLDWGDLDTTHDDLFLFSSATDEDLFTASTATAVAPPTALADVRPPMAAARGQSLYYAAQQPSLMNRALAPLRPQQTRTQRPTSSLADVGSSTQTHASRGELQFSPNRLQASSTGAARVERSARTAVPEVDTATNIAGGASSAASGGSGGSQHSASSHNTAASRTARSLLQSTAAEAEAGASVPGASSSGVGSSDRSVAVGSSDANPSLVCSSDTETGVRSSDANPIVYSSDASAVVCSPDVQPTVFSSEANSDACSSDVHSDGCSTDASSLEASSLDLCSSGQETEDPQDTQTAEVAAAQVLLVLATMTSVAESLLPALAVWSAAHASDAVAADLGNELEKMHLGASSVACQ